MVTRQQITTALTGRSAADLWGALSAHARMLQPFWAGAVTVFANRTSLPNEKRDSYLCVIDSAFDKMDGWRRGSVKYVKARRNEIDSAISYMRNKANEVPNRRFRFAPAARNAASALRVSLAAATRGYNDAQLPAVVAGIVYDAAAVRTLFPFDFGNLMVFHPGYDGTLEGDALDIALHRAGHELGIVAAVDLLLAEVERIWGSFGTPSPLVFTDGYWTAEGDDADLQLRAAAIAAFHGRS